METTHTHSSCTLTGRSGFPCGFLAPVVTFGVAFFPMFYRLVEGRNRHFANEAELEEQVAAYLKKQRKRTASSKPTVQTDECEGMGSQHHPNRARLHNHVPACPRIWQLTNADEDAFLASALPQRVFMPQTIPIKTYAIDNNCYVGRRRRVLAIQGRKLV